MTKKKEIKREYKVDLLELAYSAPDNVIKALEGMSINECKEIGCPTTEIKLVKIEPKSYHHSFAINVATDYNSSTNKIVFRQYGFLHFGSPNNNRPYLYIKVANQVLTDPYLIGCRFRVEEALGLKFKQVTKLDIACDTNVDLVKNFSYYLKQPSLTFILFRRAYNGDVEGMNKTVNELTVYAKGTRSKQTLHKGFSFAGATKYKTKENKLNEEEEDITNEEGEDISHVKNSNDGLRARCYDKKYEIEEHSGKDYLKERSSIAPEEEMFRLEASITNHKHITQTLKLINDEIAEYNNYVLVHNDNLTDGVEPLGMKSFITEEDIYVRLSDDGFREKWFRVTMDRMCRIRLDRNTDFSLIDLLPINPTVFKKKITKYLAEKKTSVS